MGGDGSTAPPSPLVSRMVYSEVQERGPMPSGVDAVLGPLLSRTSCIRCIIPHFFVSASASPGASVSLAYPPDARLLIKHSPAVQPNCCFPLLALPCILFSGGAEVMC